MRINSGKGYAKWYYVLSLKLNEFCFYMLILFGALKIVNC